MTITTAGFCSQENLILLHLKAGEPITPMEALRRYSCFRLASRISSLKKQGHPITSEIVTGNNGKRFARYKYADNR